MLTRLLTLVAVMVMIAAGWAFLVTLVSPPLSLGWRETLAATVRRSARPVAVIGIAGGVVLLILALAAGLRTEGRWKRVVLTRDGYRVLSL